MFHSNDDKSYRLEKYSSAVTLGDMEIFVFPELLFSLVLANIMSPRIWEWKNDPWFAKIDKMNPYRRTQRLRQFVMDRYEFNLDLDTWGLTTKEAELARFDSFIDTDVLSRSNALFGYEGDKYYFDMDIRRHFGLDQYEGDTIPYWKTETLEAMDAFKFKEGYRSGAGECVSLSTLFAAALFVICKIPLEDIFMLATPLHSQNFVRLKEGLITNNRRIVTKNMWYNGSEITWKSQRALRNEQVTIVANNTGYIHAMYPEATINKESYDTGMDALKDYLHTGINMEILANFLRQHSKVQPCFQIRQEHHGSPRYIEAEKVYAYEHGSTYRVSDQTRDKLLEEIDTYEFYKQPIEGRLILNHFEDFFRENPNLDLSRKADLETLIDKFSCTNHSACEVGRLLRDFCRIEPRLPDGKTFVASEAIELDPEWTREQVIDHVRGLRESHPTADLAFYAYRDLSETDWQPFIKAAIERNPVIVEALQREALESVVSRLQALPNESVYDEQRLAQPDEIWNFQRGDGLESAIALANVIRARQPGTKIQLISEKTTARVIWGDKEAAFESSKGLSCDLEI